MKSPRVIALIGPSGSGKSTLAHLIAAKNPKLTLVKSYTTRPKRSESDQNHIFVSDSQFDSLQQSGHFIGVHQAFGNRYGQPHLSTETTNLCLLRAPVLAEFTRGYPNTSIIEIDAPFPVLKARLEQRGDEDRIDQAQIENEINLGRKWAERLVKTTGSVEQSMQELKLAIEEIW